MEDAVLKKLLDTAEQLGLRRVHTLITLGQCGGGGCGLQRAMEALPDL